MTTNEKVQARTLRALQIEQASDRRQARLHGYKRMLEKISSGEPITINDVMIAWRNDRNEIFKQYVDKVHWLYDKLHACEKKKLGA